MHYGNKTFHHAHNGISSFHSRKKMPDTVADEVTDWLNKTGAAIELIKIDYEMHEFSAHAAVWYRHLIPDSSPAGPPPIRPA